jgi:hypothetical protein
MRWLLSIATIHHDTRSRGMWPTHAGATRPSGSCRCTGSARTRRTSGPEGRAWARAGLANGDWSGKHRSLRGR